MATHLNLFQRLLECTTHHGILSLPAFQQVRDDITAYLMVDLFRNTPDAVTEPVYTQAQLDAAVAAAKQQAIAECVDKFKSATFGSCSYPVFHNKVHYPANGDPYQRWSVDLSFPTPLKHAPVDGYLRDTECPGMGFEQAVDQYITNLFKVSSK